VLLAQDTQLQRTVALKIPKLADDRPSLRARVLREARAAANLGHPNICPVNDADEIDGRPYLTMAYVDGPSLAARLRQSGPWAPAEAATLVRTVALAMQHAHEKGILHRDLKPANILLNSRDEPVVTDFGLAFRLDSDTSDRLTEQGAFLWTVPGASDCHDHDRTRDGQPGELSRRKLPRPTITSRPPLSSLADGQDAVAGLRLRERRTRARRFRRSELLTSAERVLH
jgi:serine/threonine protein kinase